MSKLPTLLFPLLLVPAVSAQRITDTIHKKDGSRIRGVEVIEANLTQVKYRRGEDELELPSHTLERIEWHEPPETFLSAQAAMDRGDFETAKQMFGEAATAATREPLKREARFLQAEAAVSAAAVDAATASSAAQLAKELLDAYPDFVRVPDLMLLHGRALRLAGQGAAAEAVLSELDDRALREGWSRAWSARAKYEIAMTQVEQGKSAEARASFQAAGSAAQSAMTASDVDERELRALITKARVGEGETYVADGDYARAVDFFRGLARSAQGDDDTALLAAAKAGEGQARYLQAVETDRPADLRAAQMALAEASILDSQAGATSAKANYYLGLVLLALGPERESDSFKARAANYFQTVVKHYPSTTWAAQAKAEMTK